MYVALLLHASGPPQVQNLVNGWFDVVPVVPLLIGLGSCVIVAGGSNPTTGTQFPGVNTCEKDDRFRICHPDDFDTSSALHACMTPLPAD